MRHGRILVFQQNLPNPNLCKKALGIDLSFMYATFLMYANL